ncbi:aminotransferase class V-fold PLP-dependent enzyme [Gilvibacter sp.]|uniref:aminotransferase class V-fold PLP-dependent enzyme n=1 Tax=Gilvibacter sp. TaxID=2729997 RepID=UPI0025C731B2|nr:aminotransferase class V-fold PLP-dependent enzyme [Gilvibacter sp.]NQX76346.1 aminotransferase class V-fold PLP-dependent enzyme [Gilvibacter sp.]
MIDFENQFPPLKEFTYLNTASSGLIPKRVIEWRSQHDQDFLSQGSIFRDDHKILIEDIRGKVSNYFGASMDDIALIPNFTFGFNTLLDGFDPKMRFLMLRGDYPSLNWPVERREFPHRYVAIDANLEQNIQEAFEAEAPDVFAFSLIQYISGIRLSFDFLSDLKRAYPNTLFVADCTQFLGTEAFDFQNSPLDVVIGSCYKWMLSGYGNGLLFVKDVAKEKLYPKVIGFNSTEYKSFEREDAPFNRLFEPGHHDTLNHGSVAKAIEFVQELGTDNCFNALQAIKANAMEAFLERGLIDQHLGDREMHSSIFNLKLNADDYYRLRDAGVLTSLRGDGVRVSFHFYNSTQDLDSLLQLIAKA